MEDRRSDWVRGRSLTAWNRPLAVGRTVGLCILFLSVTAPASGQEVDDLKNGIVKIRAQQAGAGRVGTGFIVRLRDESVYIVTAAHVVEGDPHPEVAFFPRANQYYQADILGIEGGDPRGVAALIVKAPHLPPGLRAFSVSSNVNVRGGESIKVIGFPGELGTPWLVVDGSIGGRRGSDISFSAVLGEGSSGGPLLLNSSVIGIISQMGSKIGYAVPISSARFALEGWGIEFTEGGDALLPKRRVGKDGITMTLVSRGEFPMGPSGQYVFLDAFYIDGSSVAKPVPWQQAAEDCAARGKRLPTEAEWEKAQRTQAISATGKWWEWVADWYQRDYPRIRPPRNPTGPSTGESNESDLVQWDAEARSEAQRYADSSCEVPDSCKDLKTTRCHGLPCSAEDRRRHFEWSYRNSLAARPAPDMMKVVRRSTVDREGAFSRSDEFPYRCVGEP